VVTKLRTRNKNKIPIIIIPGTRGRGSNPENLFGNLAKKKRGSRKMIQIIKLY